MFLLLTLPVTERTECSPGTEDGEAEVEDAEVEEVEVEEIASAVSQIRVAELMLPSVGDLGTASGSLTVDDERAVLVDPLADVSIQVSSTHLMLASPVFERMLAGSIDEADTLRTTGRINLPLPDEDFEATLLLMRIIHSKSREISSQISFDFLVQLAIVIDKYEMLDSVKFFTDLWFHHHYLIGIPSVESATEEQLLRWLCVAWVLQQPNTFTLITSMLEKTVKSYFCSTVDELPIPKAICGETYFIQAFCVCHLELWLKHIFILLTHSDNILRRRQDSMAIMKAAITTRTTMLAEGSLSCPSTDSYRDSCSMMMLGSLTKISRELELEELLEPA